jgi:hypothetical protein
VSSYFALFSTILNGAVWARMIPANPCNGVRVTNGEFDTERLVATPAQALRAAMRLYELGLGMSGFVLCLMDVYNIRLLEEQRPEPRPDCQSAATAVISAAANAFPRHRALLQQCPPGDLGELCFGCPAGVDDLGRNLAETVPCSRP